MRDIQARRRRKIVGPTSRDRVRGVGNDPAHVSLDPEQVDVGGWENEGGAARSDRDVGALEAPRRICYTSAGSALTLDVAAAGLEAR